jgi:hypothetical protein
MGVVSYIQPSTTLQVSYRQRLVQQYGESLAGAAQSIKRRSAASTANVATDVDALALLSQHFESLPVGTVSAHYTTCGHSVHVRCFQRYFTSLVRRRASSDIYHIIEPVDQSRNEFLCPSCRSIANCVLPTVSNRPLLAQSHTTVAVTAASPTTTTTTTTASTPSSTPLEFNQWLKSAVADADSIDLVPSPTMAAAAATSPPPKRFAAPPAARPVALPTDQRFGLQRVFRTMANLLNNNNNGDTDGEDSDSSATTSTTDDEQFHMTLKEACSAFADFVATVSNNDSQQRPSSSAINFLHLLNSISFTVAHLALTFTDASLRNATQPIQTLSYLLSPLLSYDLNRINLDTYWSELMAIALPTLKKVRV